MRSHSTALAYSKHSVNADCSSKLLLKVTYSWSTQSLYEHTEVLNGPHVVRVNYKRASFLLGRRQSSACGAWHPHLYQLIPYHPQDICRFTPIPPPKKKKTLNEVPLPLLPHTCAPSSVACFLPQGNYLLLTCLLLPTLLHFGGEAAESQELPQSYCSHHPRLYTTATHQQIPSFGLQILLQPQISSITSSPPHLTRIWCAVFRWHALSFPTPSPYLFPHALQRERMFLKFGPKVPSRNNVPVPQDWVGRELLRGTVLREALSPVTLTSEW